MAGHAEGRHGEVASGDVGRQLTGYAQNHHQNQELEEVRRHRAGTAGVTHHVGQAGDHAQLGRP